MFKRQKGFTLSELLVSLSILGLIAAVSIPSIYNSVKTQREKALWKETFSTLSTLYVEAGMNGLEGKDMNDYLLTHINAKKICDTNVTTQGCYVFGHTTERGVELINGSVVNGINNGGADSIEIDINGPEGPNQLGRDQMMLDVCTIEGCSLSRPHLGFLEPRSASSDSVTLYNEIFGGS